MIETSTKTCIYCKNDLPVDGFYKNPHTKDGFRSECKICQNVKRNERRRKNPNKHRNEWMKNRFGISLEDYKEKLSEQRGVCAICGLPETSTFRGKIRNLSIDHNHATGQVRGLLCNDCNIMLGWAHDETARLVNAVKYLDFWKNVS